MMRSETHYARSGEVHVAYQVHGTGKLDLVLVPGHISNLEAQWEEPGFAHLLRRLGSFTRLILFDKRGTGLSDPVPELPNLEPCDDVRAVMDAAGVERAALLGVSEGGPIATLFAATHPERVRALVLYGTYANFCDAVLPPERLEEFLAGLERDWGSGATLRHFAPGRLGDRDFAAWWARFERLGASPHAAVALVRMNAQVDVRHALPAVRVPTLVIHRSGDVRVNVAAGRELAARIPGARWVELSGSDHPIWSGDIDRVVEEIEEFLTGSRSPAVADSILGTVLVAELAEAECGVAACGDWAGRLARWRLAVAEAAARHHARPLGPVQADGGWIAVFDGPARAARCAAALRDAVPGLLGCALRCGLHSGELPAGRDGAMEPAGLALHIARRIAGMARPGEVLVSGTVRDLVAGSGLRFRERGARLALPPEAGGLLPLLALAGDAHGSAQAPADLPVLLGLSERERQVLRLVARGLSNPGIAAELGLSGHTAKRHVANILVKLGLPSRAAAAAFAARAGLD